MKKILPILFLISCIEPFEPIVIEDGGRLLVVDASITNNTGDSYVRLEYSYPINESGVDVATGASVSVIDNNGTETTFVEVQQGLYEPVTDFSGTTGQSYQLHIRTRDGNEYISSEEELLPPASVDSIYGRFLRIASEDGGFDEGIQFFTDVSGSSNDEYNFRIEYEEDYEVFVPYPSFFEFNESDQTIENRTGPSLRVCHANEPSKGLFIATTNGQVSNELREFPLAFKQEDEPDLVGRYSLTVKAFRISSDAHKYYKDLQELNESAGSFFDRQKGKINSNIINVDDPSDLVLGYFEVASVSSDFVLFNGAQFEEDGFKAERPLRAACIDEVETIPTLLVFTNNFRFNDRLIQSFAPTFGVVEINGVEYPDQITLAPEACSDCRLYGSIEQPEFWNE